MESKAQEAGTDLEKTKGSGKEGPSVGVRVSANLEEGGRVSPMGVGGGRKAIDQGQRRWSQGEPEVSRRVCLEAATAENKWDRGKQGGCQLVSVCTHRHMHTHEHTCVFTHMHRHTYLQCAYAQAHVHTCMHICIHVCTHVCTYTCAHV